MTVKPELIVISVVCSIVLTFGLTVIALNGSSRTWACTFAWQACLVQTVIHTLTTQFMKVVQSISLVF